MLASELSLLVYTSFLKSLFVRSTLKNILGETAIQLAHQKERYEIEEMVITYKSVVNTSNNNLESSRLKNMKK